MVHLRPHHGLCIQQFVGKGYSEEFVKNMTEIIGVLEKSPQQEVELCCQADDLCRCCPHKQEQGCTSGQKVEQYDAACLALCGYTPGTRIPWKEFRETVARQILRAGKLETVCKGCEWLSICLDFYRTKTI